MSTPKFSKEQALAIADSLISIEKQRLKDSRVIRDEFIRVAQMIRPDQCQNDLPVWMERAMGSPVSLSHDQSSGTEVMVSPFTGRLV